MDLNPHSLSQLAGTVAFLCVIFDLLSQIIRVCKVKSSHDISLPGILIRIIGANLFLLKFFEIKDDLLLLGQLTLVVLLLIYLLLIRKFRRNK